jgi:hypothetical protein
MVRVGVGACLLVLLAGCGGGGYEEAVSELQELAPRTSTVTARSTAPVAADDRRIVVDGLAIRVSVPKSFRPTSSAYPRVERAVAFELTIDNEGEDAYRTAELSVTATCNGAPAQQVIDSTQGYPGVVTTEAVPPGERMRLAIAFAVPEHRSDVRLMVRPGAADEARVTLYTGTV